MTVTFEPGQSSVETGVVVINDAEPEDLETFYVELVNPRFGADIGTQRELAISILTNDNAHGVIQFAKVPYH